MKKFILITLTITLNLLAFGQSPTKFSYQAVVRNTNNTLINNQTIGMQVSIIQGSANGNIVYSETQTPTSNSNGLISIEVGNGTVNSGNLNNIDWENGPYFIQTELDPNGGNSYTINGTSQLLSVPYALHANTATSSINDNINDADSIVGNEYNNTLVLNGTSLELTDGGSTLTADLSNLQGSSNDGDPTNELINSAILDGDTLKITEGGNLNSINLTSLKSDFKMYTKDVYTTSSSSIYLADLDFVKIYSNSNYGDLVIACPSSSTKPIIATTDINGTINTYVLFPGDTQTMSSGTNAAYVKILIHRYSSLYSNAKSLLFEGHNMATGYISGMLFLRDF